MKRFSEKFEADKRTTKELISIAIADIDSEEAWTAIAIIQYRGSDEEYSAAR